MCNFLCPIPTRISFAEVPARCFHYNSYHIYLYPHYYCYLCVVTMEALNFYSVSMTVWSLERNVVRYRKRRYLVFYRNMHSKLSECSEFAIITGFRPSNNAVSFSFCVTHCQSCYFDQIKISEMAHNNVAQVSWELLHTRCTNYGIFLFRKVGRKSNFARTGIEYKYS